jgi:ligand-binding SRPBCC domain-containing protein
MHGKDSSTHRSHDFHTTEIKTAAARRWDNRSEMAVKTFQLQSQLWVPRPRVEVFDFFSSAFNLERITPSWLSFHVITPAPIEMRVGTLIDYKLLIHGVPARWQSRITKWDPPNGFADEQVRGPYRRWFHEHRFTDSSGKTLCEDSVEYAPPGGPLLGTLLNKLVVASDVRQIFEYRTARLREIFGECAAEARLVS